MWEGISFQCDPDSEFRVDSVLRALSTLPSHRTSGAQQLRLKLQPRGFLSILLLHFSCLVIASSGKPYSYQEHIARVCHVANTCQPNPLPTIVA